MSKSGLKLPTTTKRSECSWFSLLIKECLRGFVRIVFRQFRCDMSKLLGKKSIQIEIQIFCSKIFKINLGFYSFIVFQFCLSEDQVCVGQCKNHKCYKLILIHKSKFFKTEFIGNIFQKLNEWKTEDMTNIEENVQGITTFLQVTHLNVMKYKLRKILLQLTVNRILFRLFVQFNIGLQTLRIPVMHEKNICFNQIKILLKFLLNSPIRY